MYYYDEILLFPGQLSLSWEVRNKSVSFLQYSKSQSYRCFISVFIFSVLVLFATPQLLSTKKDSQLPDQEESSLKRSCFVSGTYFKSQPVLSIQMEVVPLEVASPLPSGSFQRGDDAPDFCALSWFSISVSVMILTLFSSFYFTPLWLTAF